MLTLNELWQHISAYKKGYVSFEEFENWFEDNSNGAYAVAELSAACAAVNAALSEYHFDSIGENVLKDELANAIRPFVAAPPRTVGIYLRMPRRVGSVDIQKFQSGAVGTLIDENPPSPKSARSTNRHFRLLEVTA